MSYLSAGSFTHSGIQTSPYHNICVRKSIILQNDFRNGNSVGTKTPVSIQDDTETLLHRIAFTVWHTALHIEREVRLSFIINSTIA
jgi:hypothetical protein